MILASEDVLSEAVLRRLLSAFRPELAVSASLGLRGKSYLQSRARELNRTARGVPVFLLVDLDRPSSCAPELLAEWFGTPLEPQMLFRVAVVEVESWLLADRHGLSTFIGVPVNRIPLLTDGIEQPKEFLVNLARRAKRRAVREELVPEPGATTSVGPGYNSQLSWFVSQGWNPSAAAASSDSLRRGIDRLCAFTP